MVQAIYAEARVEPVLVTPESDLKRWERSEAVRELARGRMEVTGPVTASELADTLRLAKSELDAALLALESEGFVLRGKFRPDATGLEWCDRRLLARIHRLTLNRLRAEIQPVSIEDFQRFLLAWQRVSADHRAEGPGGLESVLGSLDGCEIAAAAWEPEVLAARVKDYTPEWLDRLCLTGRVGWGRLSPRASQKSRGAAPVRSTPISVFDRQNLAHWLELSGRPAQPEFSADTEQVLKVLLESGAMFFGELVRAARLLPSRVGEALGELAAHGWASADSFEGLRALIVPSEKRSASANQERRGRHKTVTSLEF